MKILPRRELLSNRSKSRNISIKVVEECRHIRNTMQWDAYSVDRYLRQGYLKCVTKEKRLKPATEDALDINISSRAAQAQYEVRTPSKAVLTPSKSPRRTDSGILKDLRRITLWLGRKSEESRGHSFFPHFPRYGCLLLFAGRRLSSTQFSCPADPDTALFHHKSHGPAAVDDHSGDNDKCGPVQDEHWLERPAHQFV